VADGAQARAYNRTLFPALANYQCGDPTSSLDGCDTCYSRHTMTRRFPAPWTVEKTPGGFKVLDANGHSLAYVYAGDKSVTLTEDEARRIASNIAKLPTLLSKQQ
jgi:hypothetical protein